MSTGKLKIKTKIISKFEMVNVPHYRVLKNVHCRICIFPEYVTYHRQIQSRKSVLVESCYYFYAAGCFQVIGESSADYEVLLRNCETSQDPFKLYIDGSGQYIT